MAQRQAPSLLRGACTHQNTFFFCFGPTCCSDSSCVLKVTSQKSGEEGWAKVRSLREFDGPLSPEERRTGNTPPEKYRGRVVLWRRTTSKMKKDTEQYSRSKVLQRHRWQRQSSWTLSHKLLGMTGEKCDAISAYTQVKVTEAPRLLRMPKEERPAIWIRIPPRQMSKSWDKIDDPSMHLEENFKKCQLKRDGKVPARECLYVNTKLRLFYACI